MHMSSEALWNVQQILFHPFASNPEGPVDPDKPWTMDCIKGPSIWPYTTGWGWVAGGFLLSAEDVARMDACLEDVPGLICHCLGWMSSRVRHLSA